MRAVQSWGAVVLTAAAFYGAFTLAALALHGWNPLWFVWIGERYASGDLHGHVGYDGQFVYYIARDGMAAVPHLDSPAYRLGRILYPALIAGLSGGDMALIPWVMVAINFAAILTTTALLTRWLIERGLPRWYGLVYPFYVGTLMAFSRDLTEPLAYALAVAGMLAWFEERRAAAVALLALAGLTREATLLFPAALAIAELFAGRWTRAVTAAIAALPFVLWYHYLIAGLGLPPRQPGTGFGYVAVNLFSNLSFEIGRVSSLLFVGLPILALTPLAVRWLLRVPRDPIAWLIALHIGLALILPFGVHVHIFSASRTLSGLLIGLLLAFPRCSPRFRAVVAAVAVGPALMWLPVLLWWAPWTATV
jgi:hypothetical protein